MRYSRQDSIPNSLPKTVQDTGRRVLAERIFEALQQSITDGELRPNQRLVESEIARKLGTSRAPVHDALKRLEMTGYASANISGGLVVADHTMQIQSLYQIREALECMALELSCANITEKQIRKAEGYYTGICEAIQNHDTEKYIKLHRAFHEELCSACENDRLMSLISTFRYQYFDIRLARLQTARELSAISKYHAQILEAARKRNGLRASKLLRRHFRYSQKIALRRL